MDENRADPSTEQNGASKKPIKASNRGEDQRHYADRGEQQQARHIPGSR